MKTSKIRKFNFVFLIPAFIFTCSDQSQSDSSTKDFWMNMQAITLYLKKLSEQNPSASYYNVDVLKYQVCLFIFWRIFKRTFVDFNFTNYLSWFYLLI